MRTHMAEQRASVCIIFFVSLNIFISSFVYPLSWKTSICGITLYASWYANFSTVGSSPPASWLYCCCSSAMAAAPAPDADWYDATCMRLICERRSIGFRHTTIMMVVQLGLAMMPRGRTRASSALHSGTTRGTSSSIRKALELSIMTAP